MNGQILTQLRLRKGWSQRKLAEELGYTQSFVSYLEGKSGDLKDKEILSKIRNIFGNDPTVSTPIFEGLKGWVFSGDHLGRKIFIKADLLLDDTCYILDIPSTFVIPFDRFSFVCPKPSSNNNNRVLFFPVVYRKKDKFTISMDTVNCWISFKIKNKGNLAGLSLPEKFFDQLTCIAQYVVL